MADAAPFALNPRLDPEALHRRFVRSGRVEIADFLAPGVAEALRAHLLSRADWVLVLNAGAKVFEIPRRQFLAMEAEQLRKLDALVAAEARQGFQYRYEAIRVPDEAEERLGAPDLLTRFVGFLSSAPVLDLLRAVTGFSEIGFADGQATSYSPGHFLTRHDDAVEGKNRKAAYVLGLTENWQAEYGGLLMFHRGDGNIEEAFTPAMGALRVFAVPVSHSVSYVAPFAPEPRLSITGWLRSRDD
jgi:Rps23 Pro-64 3,4-dihydroxylase Tpa1-like proline 4-hydroxylase